MKAFLAAAQQQGFTLIELMIGLLVMALILGFAVPTFQAVTANNAMRSSAADFITAMNTARTQAVNLRQDITLTQIDSDWSKGWEIQYNGAPGETDQSFSPSGSVTVKESNSKANIVFTESGVVSNAPFTFDFCDSSRSGETGREITLSRFGQIKNADQTCS